MAEITYEELKRQRDLLLQENAELREFRAVNYNGLCDAEGRLIAPPQTWAYVEDLG